MAGHQVNLRFDEVEVDRLKEIADRHGVIGNGKQEPHTKLIRDTVQAIYFASAKEQAEFLEKFAYRKNLEPASTLRVVGDWDRITVVLDTLGLTPEVFSRDWLPIIKTLQEIGLDIQGSPDEIYSRASRLGAILTVVNAVSAKSETVRQSAIKDLMDRAGYKTGEREDDPINQINKMSMTEVDAKIVQFLDKFGVEIVSKKSEEKIA